MLLSRKSCIVDTVASTIQSTAAATQKTAQSAFDTGKSYTTSAKGTYMYI